MVRRLSVTGTGISVSDHHHCFIRSGGQVLAAVPSVDRVFQNANGRPSTAIRSNRIMAPRQPWHSALGPSAANLHTTRNWPLALSPGILPRRDAFGCHFSLPNFYACNCPANLMTTILPAADAACPMLSSMSRAFQRDLICCIGPSTRRDVIVARPQKKRKMKASLRHASPSKTHKLPPQVHLRVPITWPILAQSRHMMAHLKGPDV